MRYYQHSKKLYVLFITLILVLTSSFAFASRTLQVGEAEGKYGTTVSMPVSLDDVSDVGGVAFTINYDQDVLEFLDIKKADVLPVTNGSGYKVPEGEVKNGTEYYNPYRKEDPYSDADYTLAENSTLFYQTNNKPSDGIVMVAGASAAPLESNALFEAEFKIKDASGFEGNTTIRLSPSYIDNPAAGYNGPTEIPALTGMPADSPNQDGYYDTPTFSVEFDHGRISVLPTESQTYKISGTAYYGSSTDRPAANCDVALHKMSDNYYVLQEVKSTSSNGTFTFNGKLSGEYKLTVDSNNNDYYDERVKFSVKDTDKELGDMLLSGSEVVQGKVKIGSQGDSKVIEGLKVEVRNAQGERELVGKYRVDEDGSYQSDKLPPGEYDVKAVYGNKEFDITSGETDYINLDLNTIKGVIAGLEQGKKAAVKAISQNASLSRTDKSSEADQNNNASYTVQNLLPAVDYIVSAVGENLPVRYYNSTSNILNATQVDIRKTNATNINFHYKDTEKGVINGTIVKNDEPVSGVQVFAFNSANSNLISTSTNSSGEYKMEIPTGDYELYTFIEGNWYYYDGESGTQDGTKAELLELNANDSLECNFEVTFCKNSLSGKVSMQNGDPVDNVLVKAVSSDKTSKAIDMTNEQGE